LKRYAIPIPPADGWSHGSGSISIFYEDAGGLRIVSIGLNGFPGSAKNSGQPEEETRTPVPDSPAREILLRLDNAIREHFSHGNADYGSFFPYLNTSANEKEIRVVDILKKSHPGDIMSYSTLAREAGLGKKPSRRHHELFHPGTGSRSGKKRRPVRGFPHAEKSVSHPDPRHRVGQSPESGISPARGFSPCRKSFPEWAITVAANLSRRICSIKNILLCDANRP